VVWVLFVLWEWTERERESEGERESERERLMNSADSLWYFVSLSEELCHLH
jgi:hypothetical protein